MLRLASNLDPSYVPNWDPLDSGLANPVLVAERRNNKKS